MRVSLCVTLAAGVAVLAGCGKSQDSTSAPSPPADALPAAADFSRPLNALGDEPFWALKIRPEGLTFSTTGAKDVTTPNAGPKTSPDQAVWTAADADGHALTATLKAAVCQDPMSGLSYPFTTTLETGGRVLHGCGAYADAMPKGGN